MFFGEYRHSIDTKGRLSIPAKMRNQCGDVVYVTRGNDGCLDLYTEEGWEEYYREELENLSKKKKVNRTYKRLITSRVSVCEFDKLGRMNIPSTLRETGHLEKECVIIGVGDHIEIWNQQEWDSFYEENESKLDEIAEDLDEEE